MASSLRVRKLVSGGQTGVDRAALDVARQLGLDHGGWCPHGRRAEDGRIPSRYNLRETASANYRVRTEQNVIDSDATVLLFRHRLTGGTALTLRFAAQHGKPHYLVDLAAGSAPQSLRDWLRDQRVGVVNVAGPRESSAPGIGAAARSFLKDALQPRQRARTPAARKPAAARSRRTRRPKP